MVIHEKGSESGPLRVPVRLNEGVAIVSPEGELDLATVDRFEDALSLAFRERPRVLVVDLHGLDFMDSTGLRALLLAQQRCQYAGARLVLHRAQGATQRLLKVSGVEGRFEFVEDPEELTWTEPPAGQVPAAGAGEAQSPR